MTDERTPPPTPEPPTTLHGLLASHTTHQLIEDLQDHLEWARLHLIAARERFPDHRADPAISDIDSLLREALSYLVFGDLVKEVKSNG